MKYFISLSLMLFSTIVYAQTSNQPDPMNPGSANQQATKPANPNISITPSINTTVTSQPPSYPGSNTNPTTGTVIGLKPNKNAVKADKTAVSAMPDTLLGKRGTTIPQRKITRKHKREVKL
ncbi:hypothetical protein BH11BAC4_BH11BAC4_09480 [soil metagenome]